VIRDLYSCYNIFTSIDLLHWLGLWCYEGGWVLGYVLYGVDVCGWVATGYTIL